MKKRPLSRRAQASNRAAAIVGRSVNRAAQVDAELRQRATRLETDFFAICDLVDEVRAESYHARFGFVDVERYLEDRIGLSYRSIARRLGTAKAVRGLPERDRPEATAQLAALGATKAAILAPALKQDPTGWRDWTKKAATETVDGLQRKVTVALGLKARGPSTDAPGSRWLVHTLNLIEDPEKRAEVEEAFQLGMKLAQTDNALRVFLALVEECLQEWRLRVQAGVE